jgi:hypothetical protein
LKNIANLISAYNMRLEMNIDHIIETSLILLF